ncbi:MAG: response regulator [Planctomycetota bacterium]|nr:response regulator [Planctomycetota bacterium]
MDRPVRILVADDDAPTRRLLSAALSLEGLYEVVTARDGAEALKIYHDSPGFDLVLTALAMPAMSGFELTEKIRALGSDIPILVLSSLTTDQSIASALEAGADDYLQKPVDLRKLRAAVAELIDRYRSRRAARPAGAGGGAAQPAGGRREPVVRNVESGTFVELTSLTDTHLAERFQRFAERALAMCLSDRERSELRLALEEIVRNAIEWGNQNDPTKELRLSYCLLPDRITFRVEDEGAGFNPTALKDPSVDPQAHIRERRASGKRMGGWGIFLAKKMVDEVTFNSRGNVVFLTKYLRRGGSIAGAVPAPPANDTAVLAAPPMPQRRTTRLLRKTTRLLRKEDPRFNAAQQGS